MIIEEKTLYASDLTSRPQIKITAKTGKTEKGVYTCYHVYFHNIEAFKTMFIEKLSAFMRDAEHNIYKESLIDAEDAYNEQQTIREQRNQKENESYAVFSGSFQIIPNRPPQPKAKKNFKKKKYTEY